MARYLEYDWIPSSTDANEICLEQGVAAGIPLVFNGKLAVENGKRAVIKNNLRFIAIKSPDDLSGNTITISGTQLGVPVTWSGIGPNSTTIGTNVLFDSITSITTSANVDRMSIGLTITGYISPIFINPYTSYTNYLLYVAPQKAKYTIKACALKREINIPFSYFVDYLIDPGTVEQAAPSVFQSEAVYQFLTVLVTETALSASLKVVFNQPSTGS